MAIDLFHSRRGRFHRCLYYLRDERTSIGDASKWILNRQPEGVFYAKPYSPETKSGNPISGVFMSDKNNKTIETEDDIDGMMKGSIVVEEDGSIWMVDNIQSSEHVKESEFSIHSHYSHVISLRR